MERQSEGGYRSRQRSSAARGARLALALLVLLWSLSTGRSAGAVARPEGRPPDPLRLARIRARQKGFDFARLSRDAPRLEIPVLLVWDKPPSLETLTALRRERIRPVNGELGDYLFALHGVFRLPAGKLPRLQRLAGAREVIPLARFALRGMYEVNFEVVEPGFEGPMRFSVSSPRPHHGIKLVSVEEMLHPDELYAVRVDAAANRWVEVDYPWLEEGDELRFVFAFRLRVDLLEMLRQSVLTLPGRGVPAPLPETSPMRGFIRRGEKMEPDSEEIRSLARGLFGPLRAPRAIWNRMRDYLKRTVTYDGVKRSDFFGGRKVYRSMREMYDPPSILLQRRQGACPDTSVLEASLFRAMGIPARTAGRWGHFFSEVWVPDRGWVTTSPKALAIPIVVDPSPHHRPFVDWQPEVRVQTTRWSGYVRVIP